MAIFTRTSGDFQPVVVVDQGVNATSPGAGYNTGINTVVSGATVNVAGPKLGFATVTLTGSSTTAAQLGALFQTIQQRCTIAMYEWTTDTNDTLAFAYYPVDGWGDVTATAAGSLDAELTAALGEAVSVAATATFTN